MSATVTGIPAVAAVVPAGRPGSSTGHPGGFADLMKQAMATANPVSSRKDPAPGKREQHPKEAPEANTAGGDTGPAAKTPTLSGQDAAPLPVTAASTLDATLPGAAPAPGLPSLTSQPQLSPNQVQASAPMALAVGMGVAVTMPSPAPTASLTAGSPVQSALPNAGAQGGNAIAAPVSPASATRSVGATSITPTPGNTPTSSSTPPADPSTAATQASALKIVTTGPETLTSTPKNAPGHEAPGTAAGIAPGLSGQPAPLVSVPAGTPGSPAAPTASADTSVAATTGTHISSPVADATSPTTDQGTPAAAAKADPTPRPLDSNTPAPFAAPTQAAAITLQGTPQPTPAAPAQPTPATYAEQVAKPVFTLASTAAPGEHVMVLKVTPDNLGPVTVQAHITNTSVRIELFAPTEAGREALRQVMPDLKRDIASAGLQTQLNLSSGDHPGAQQGDTGRNAFNQRTTTPNPGTTNSRQLLMDTPSSVTHHGLSGTDAVLDVMA